MPLTEQQILEALRAVRDPEAQQDIVALNQVRAVKLFEGSVSVVVATAAPDKERLRQNITAAVSRLEGVAEVFVHFTAPSEAPKAAGPGQRPGYAHEPPAPRGLPGVRQIVAVGAGKGGVGKSTVAVNLALGLALRGKKVGLLDGDIYGPSIPTLTGIAPQPPRIDGEHIIPFWLKSPDHPGLSMAVMSIGFMVDREKALIWRGPMAHGAMKQMLEQVAWNDGGAVLDYLIVDLPPGTGDVSLTLAQSVPLAGAVMVATPQEVALADARRAVHMFEQLGVAILGVVENMSYFVCDHGTTYDIFGKGGAQTMAREMGLTFLGALPIHMSLRRNSDAGKPFDNFRDGCPSREPLLALAEAVDKQVASRAAGAAAGAPDLEIT